MRFAFAALLIILIGLQYRLWVGDGSLSEVVQLKAELAEQKAIVDRLTQRNKTLERRVVELQSGTETIEELARKNLGMIKQGETFYQIVNPSPNEPKANE